MIHYVHRGYPEISILSEIYSSVICVKVSVTTKFQDCPCFFWSISIAKLWMLLAEQILIHLFAGVLQKMTVWHFKYVPDVFHFNALFCFYSDDCEAFKSVGSNSVTKLCVKKELLKGLRIYIYILYIYIYICIWCVYIYRHIHIHMHMYTYMIIKRKFWINFSA